MYIYNILLYRIYIYVHFHIAFFKDIRSRIDRPVRANAQKVLWWTEDDVNHIISGKQLLLRRASNAASKTDPGPVVYSCKLNIG